MYLIVSPTLAKYCFSMPTKMSAYSALGTQPIAMVKSLPVCAALNIGMPAHANKPHAAPPARKLRRLHRPYSRVVLALLCMAPAFILSARPEITIQDFECTASGELRPVCRVRGAWLKGRIGDFNKSVAVVQTLAPGRVEISEGFCRHSFIDGLARGLQFLEPLAHRREHVAKFHDVALVSERSVTRNDFRIVVGHG